MKCEKTTFLNIDEARKRLTKIVLYSDRKNKPIRVYKCEKCGKFHLTSKTVKEYNENKKNKSIRIRERNKKREKSFISRESKYWENYFEANK